VTFLPHDLSGEPRYRVDDPIMTQQWRTLSYLHWPYAPGQVQAMLPDGIDVDTYDGAAWVGLVPFHMVDIAARFTPPIPYLGTFPETNIRTYVLGPEGPGVWFHSLDISRLLPVVVARLTYRLPYIWARMTIRTAPGRIEYWARRRWPGPRGARSKVVVDIGEPIDRPTPFEHFLSARWGLYTMLGRRLAHARVEHAPWPLHRATLVEVDDEFAAAAGYHLGADPPHVLYSPGVSVRIERPRFVASGGNR
jgi:uncharacterized protein YqjF (DUF2071 family)